MAQPNFPAGYDVITFDVLDSTNEEARRRAELGERGPLWIMAKRQTAGRGRRGREWASPEGNLMATLLLAPRVPVAEAAGLSFVAALATYDLVAKYLQNVAVQIKWPNDVLLDGKKAAGILLESSADTSAPVLPWLAIGIGVNLCTHPADTAFPATSIAKYGAALSPEEALCGLALSFERRFCEWRMSGFSAIRHAWLAAAAGLGSTITVQMPLETLVGQFETILEDGSLVLMLPNGAQRFLSAGEVYFGRTSGVPHAPCH